MDFSQNFGRILIIHILIILDVEVDVSERRYVRMPVTFRADFDLELKLASVLQHALQHARLSSSSKSVPRRRRRRRRRRQRRYVQLGTHVVVDIVIAAVVVELILNLNASSPAFQFKRASVLSSELAFKFRISSSTKATKTTRSNTKKNLFEPMAKLFGSFSDTFEARSNRRHEVTGDKSRCQEFVLTLQQFLSFVFFSRIIFRSSLGGFGENLQWILGEF